MTKAFKIERSGLVQAPVEAIYSVAADVSSYPEFLSGLEWVKVQDRIVEMAVRVGPLHLVWQQEVTFDPYRAISFRQTRGPFRRFHGGWRFSPNGDGTCVLYYTEFEIDLPFGLDRIMRRTLERNVDQVMVSFRRRLARVLQQEESTVLQRRCPFLRHLEQVLHKTGPKA